MFYLDVGVSKTIINQ